MKKLLLFFFILELCVAFSSVRQDFLYFSQDGTFNGKLSLSLYEYKSYYMLFKEHESSFNFNINFGQKTTLQASACQWNCFPSQTADEYIYGGIQTVFTQSIFGDHYNESFFMDLQNFLEVNSYLKKSTAFSPEQLYFDGAFHTGSVFSYNDKKINFFNSSFGLSGGIGTKTSLVPWYYLIFSLDSNGQMGLLQRYLILSGKLKYSMINDFSTDVPLYIRPSYKVGENQCAVYGKNAFSAELELKTFFDFEYFFPMNVGWGNGLNLGSVWHDSVFEKDMAYDLSLRSYLFYSFKEPWMDVVMNLKAGIITDIAHKPFESIMPFLNVNLEGNFLFLLFALI